MASYLFCLPRYHTNAVPWMRILKAAGHDVTIDVAEFGPTENWECATPVRHEPSALCKRVMGNKLSGPDAMFYIFPSWRQYWRHMQKENPDVVIVRGITRWFPRIAAACALLQRRKLVIYDQEDVAPRRWSKTWLRRAFCRIVGIPHITPRMTVEGDRKSIGNALNIPFGCPYSKIAHPAAGNWPPRILMVGKYRERKGHAQLIEALATISRERTYQLTFCGEQIDQKDADFCASLVARANQAGIGDRIVIRNNIAHREMVDLYRSHDLVILPSRFESGGMSPVEGVWLGCAAAVSRDLGTRGYFPPSRMFDFDPQRPDDIARALSNLLESPTTLASAKTMCGDHIRRVASDSIIESKFANLLRS